MLKDAILDWFDSLSSNKDVFLAVDRYVKRIIESTNNIRYESGLIDQAEFDGNKARFNHYVPLRGDLVKIRAEDDRKNVKEEQLLFGALAKKISKLEVEGQNMQRIYCSVVAQIKEQ